MSILEILAKKNIIGAKDIGKIKDKAKASNSSLEDVVVESGVKDDEILAAYGDYYKIPTRKLETKDISFSLLKYIPEESATHYRFVPIGLKDGVL
ncbi:MAG: hypothetical protein AAB965_01500, partial [Patescibacteria group bacterium]